MKLNSLRLTWVDLVLLALTFVSLAALGWGLRYEIRDRLSWGQGFCKRAFEDEEGNDYNYQVFIPYAYQSDKKWPLIVFLHGAAHTGSDGDAPVQNGLAPVIRTKEQDFPCFVLFPQANARSWQAGGNDAQRALAIVDRICWRFSIDPDRIYLTGLSMGGGGTWSLANAYPERWAAIVPVCGYGDPAWAPQISKIPCWCFHGAKDEVVSVNQSRKMIEALKEAGGAPRYTEYPNVRHDAWVLAYQNEELYEWLFKQRRVSKPAEVAPGI